VPADLAAVAGAFAEHLHLAGLPVSPERAGWFAAAVAAAAPTTTAELYWLGCATLVTAHEHLAVFDAVFAQVFGGIVDDAVRGDPTAPATRPAAASRRTDTPKSQTRESMRAASGGFRVPGSSTGDDGDGDGVVAAMSAEERLGTKDFGQCTPEELAALTELIGALALAAPRRPNRRRARHPAGDRLDLRRTLRRAQRTGGDPVRHIHRRRNDRPRRVVLIADVSGSMETYSRAYLYLLHGAVRSVRAEAFVFATRLTRTTRQLRVTSPDLALQRATASAVDFAGGTRIGDALKEFNDRWGRRGLARGAVVVIVSDGWDGGDPARVDEQMARLARLAHRIVWVNPRKQSDRYEPAVGGMRAALPYVDAFVSGHSLAAMDDVLAAISGQ
jgi:uncharacterized protein with von Willebrand factor type A (vWA) domain